MISRFWLTIIKTETNDSFQTRTFSYIGVLSTSIFVSMLFSDQSSISLNWVIKGDPLSVFMSTAISPHIHLWDITKRVSEIAVAGQPISQFISSNNYKLTKSNLTGHQDVFRVDIAVVLCCTLITNIFSLVSIFLMLRASKMKYASLFPDGYLKRI